MLPGQLSLFEVTSPSTSVVGLSVLLQSVCRTCGSNAATIGSSKGPHHAALICGACGSHMGWMSGASFKFISEIVDRIGRPQSAIIVRNSSYEGF
jgi:uncharacterized membrane protein